MYLATSSTAGSAASSLVPAQVGATGFYVSVRTGARAHAALALGPYNSRAAARREVDRVRQFATGQCRHAGWWLYETARVTVQPGRPLPTGTLNALLAPVQEAA